MNRARLLATLEVVGRALATNSPVPIFTHFCFDGGKIHAFNYIDGIAIVADTEEKGTYALHGETLLGLLRNSSSEEVDFKSDGSFVGPSCILLTSGKSKFKLPYLNKEDFVFKPPSEFEYDFSPADDQAWESLGVCWATAGSDKSTALFAGVAIINEPSGVCLYSTDGDAFTRVTGFGYHTIKFKNILLPYKFCSILTKLEFSSLHFNDKWVCAQCGVYKVYGQLLEEEPIDYKSDIDLIFKEAKPEFIQVPEGFKEALRRAQVLAGKETKPTTLSIGGGGVELTTETQLGHARDIFQFNGPKHELDVSVSAALVERSILLCDEMAITENCCLFRKGEKVLIVLGNM